MSKRWTDKDIEELKKKGLKVDEQIKQKTDHKPVNKPKKIEKISVEKNAIDLVLMVMNKEGIITEFVKELKFDDNRRFRFDWAIIDLKIAIEYEGIYSKKSRHTTQEGYNRDTEKYNLATAKGWRVLRYTAANYKNLQTDILKLINTNQIMKSTETFKKTISEQLDKVAANDQAFAEKMNNPKKNIDDCVTYILNTVKKSGCNGFTDDEIYGMAIHYYDEENVEVGGKVSAQVVVNHVVEISEEEKAEAKQKAIDLLIQEAKEAEKDKLVGKVELSEEDLAEVNQKAIDKLVADKKEKLTQKAAKKKAENKPTTQGELF